MKIKSINIIDDNNEVKEYEILDSIIMAICKNENDEKQPLILSQISENASLQLSMMKNIMLFVPQQEEKESPIEIIDEE